MPVNDMHVFLDLLDRAGAEYEVNHYEKHNESEVTLYDIKDVEVFFTFDAQGSIKEVT